MFCSWLPCRGVDGRTNNERRSVAWLTDERLLIGWSHVRVRALALRSSPCSVSAVRVPCSKPPRTPQDSPGTQKHKRPRKLNANAGAGNVGARPHLRHAQSWECRERVRGDQDVQRSRQAMRPRPRKCNICNARQDVTAPCLVQWSRAQVCMVSVWTRTHERLQRPRHVDVRPVGQNVSP